MRVLPLKQGVCAGTSTKAGCVCRFGNSTKRGVCAGLVNPQKGVCVQVW